MTERCAVQDLAIGAVIHLDGFDVPLTVRSAKKIKKGPDAGKLDVTLVTAEGATERVALEPQEQVPLVRPKPAAEAERSVPGKVAAQGGKGKTKAKAPAQAQPELVAASLPQTPPPATPTETEPPPPGRRSPKASAAPKLSALDAAAKVLSETGTALTCQELIQVMAEKGYWTSPNGKTPAATLYTAILKELKTKGAQARFQKTAPGKFAATP
jgi:HB1, ASXL, restriction endonuclease HTH domain